MTTYTERVDDIPLLVAEFEKSDLIGLLDDCFPDHGKWRTSRRWFFDLCFVL